MAHLLVIGLVLGEDLFSEFLFAFVDVLVQLVSVLSDRELLVVINWDVDLLGANWLFVWVVELGNVRVLQSLVSCQSFVWIEL